MNSFKLPMLAIIGIGILLGSFVLIDAPASQGAAPSRDVNVANTPANPVPTRNVDSAARQAVTFHDEVSLPDGSFGDVSTGPSLLRRGSGWFSSMFRGSSSCSRVRSRS